MFDILERVAADDDEAPVFHFDALAVDNEVDWDDNDASRIFRSERIPEEEHAQLPYFPF